MDSIIRKHLTERLHLGDLQNHKELSVVPLFCTETGGPDYVTLKEALADGSLTISEVSEGGSVPELKVINSGANNVLMLDGEELAGAKQNRVLNTTILIAAGSSALIPVSCTEQGRWSYRSAHFEDSNVSMSPSLRSRKNASVSFSLNESRGYRSDQGAVWESIEELHSSHRTSSGTGAMKDAYEARREDLSAYQDAFPCLDGQSGMAVLIKGRVAGIEMVSRPLAYQQLHAKLLNSYAMDIPQAPAGQSPAAIEKVRKILERMMEAEEKRFQSVGRGEDCRYTARGLLGSGLLVDEWFVHMAFFRTNERHRSRTTEERMAPMSHRRASRAL
ncbi:MAG TPA: hypothetical protein HPP76_06950 [Desulfuromonadales bacterium]|nr:hypothetical protein [Desulfuromonadales bacterium]